MGFILPIFYVEGWVRFRGVKLKAVYLVDDAISV